MTEPTLPAWLGPDGLGPVASWVDAELGATRRTSPLVAHAIKPWSVVCRTTTSAGAVYFKAQPAPLRSEVPLSHFLSEHWPDKVAQVLASDAQRGWMLLSEMPGRVMRGTTAGDDGVRVWARMLRALGAFQLELVGHVDALLATGVRDGRVDRIPDLFDELLATGMLQVGDDALSDTEVETLRTRRPTIAATCRVLAELQVPCGLVHNDLHDGNVFMNPDGGFVFFDWGDSFVAPAFCDGLLALRVAAARFGLRDDAPEIRALRDAYLDPWRAAFVAQGELIEAFEQATRVAPIFHALTWHRIAATPGGEAEADSVARWARRLLTS